MKLNEYLKIRLGIIFEDKYNSLVVREINSNQDKYPHICQEFIGKTKSFNSSLFDNDDDQMCANINQALELYKAFFNVFIRDVREKNLIADYASFGISYLKNKNVESLFDPYLNYIAISERCINKDETKVIKKIFKNKHEEVDRPIGEYSIDTIEKTFCRNNKELLKKLTNDLIEISNCYEENNLCSDYLEETFIANKVGYNVYTYEYKFGKNYLRFFACGCGFDLFSIIRIDIDDAISQDTINKLELFKNINFK